MIAHAALIVIASTTNSSKPFNRRLPASCDVRAFPHSLACSPRAQALAWYIANERACHRSSALHDNYQFGVPSEMQSIAETLGGHHTYWGFDSFRGMPDSSQEPGYRNPLWQTGTFADIYSLSKNFEEKRSNHGTSDDRIDYVPVTGKARPLTVAQAVEVRQTELRAKANRIRLVAGFYNESLTNIVAKHGKPAFFVDLNCDLYVSTFQALSWMLQHRLLRPGSILSYDDWFNTPFGHGESRAHQEIAQQHLVSFDHLTATHKLDNKKYCKTVFFRVKSIGGRADAGLTQNIRHGNRYWNRR
jgi:hypothetical protein